MADLRVLVGVKGGASISGDSGQLIIKELKSIAEQIRGSHTPRVRVAVNINETKRIFEQQLQAIVKGITPPTVTVNTKVVNAGKQPQVFDTAALAQEGRAYYDSTADIIDRVKKQFAAMGKVDVQAFRNAKDEIQSFTVSIKDAETVVEKLEFQLAKLKDGSGAVRDGFVQMRSALTDKTAGTGLENTLNYLNRVDAKLQNLSSRTLTTGGKVLLPSMAEYGQFNTKLKDTKDGIDQIRKSTAVLSDEHKRQIDAMIADLTRYTAELQRSAYASGEMKSQPLSVKKTQLQAELDNIVKQMQGDGIYTGKFEQEINNLRNLLNNAVDSTGLDDYTYKLKLLRTELKGVALDDSAWDDLLKADTLATKISTAQMKIANLKTTYGAFVSDPALHQEWKSLFDQAGIIKSQDELTALNAKVAQFEQKLISAGKHSASVFTQLAQSAQKMVNFMVVGTAMSVLTHGIRGIYDSVVDVDKAMVELRKVTDENESAYSHYMDTVAKRSVEIGTGLADLIQATSNFARLGEYSVAIAEQLAEVATIYKVVGDEIDSVDDATNSIISTMQAFNINESGAMSIIDKLNEVANTAPITAGGLGEALTRSASALSAANNTLDESIALITASNEVVQNPEVVANAWKTIAMRVRGARVELEEAGLDTDGMVESTSKLRDTIMAITNVDGMGGVDILADADTFKSTYQIIEGVSKVWKDISDVDQAALLELLADKRNANALAAAIDNFATAERVLETSLNSEGSALAEHEKWLDSIEAKQQQFAAQYEAFSNEILDSNLVKFAFDSGTGILGFLTEIVSTMGAIPPLMSTLYGIRSVANGKGVFQLDTSQDWGGSGIGITTAFTANKQAAADFAAQLNTDYQSLLRWENAVAGGKHTMDDFNTALQGASAKARTYAAETRGAAGSATAFRVAQEQAAMGAQKVGVASTIASVGVQALNLALNMALAFGVTFAIQGVITLITSMGKETEKAAEKMQELGDTFEQTKSEVESLESELESVQERLEELNALAQNGQITPDQTSELKQLRETNDELERELAIKRELAEIQAQELEQAAVDTYQKTTYRSITGTTESRSTARGTIEVGAELHGAEMILDLVEGMKRVKAEQDELRDGWKEQGLTAEETDRKIAGLQTTYDSYSSKAATVVNEQKEIADAITNTSGSNYEQKAAIVAAIDAWMEFRVQAGGAASEVKTEVDSLTESVDNLADHLGALDTAGTKVRALSDALSEFSEDGSVSIKTLLELKETFGDSEALERFISVAGSSKSTFTQVQAAASALAEEYLNSSAVLDDVTESTAELTITELENIGVLNAAEVVWQSLTQQTVKAKLSAEDFATASGAVISALVEEARAAGIAAESIGAIIQLEKMRTQIGTGGLTGTEYREKIESLAKQAQAQVEALNAGLVDTEIKISVPESVGTGSSNAQTELEKQIQATKNAFQAEYDAWKHKLDMERITLEEFYAWLDGEDGYKSYFADQSKFADEWRKYEKEVFDGVRQVHEEYLDVLDHEIAVLKRQEDSENAVIEKYADKRTEIRKLKDALEDYLRAEGATDAEIISNEQYRTYINMLHTIEDEIESVQNEAFEETQSHINDLIDLTEDYIRQLKKNEIEALEDAKSQYAEMVNLQKELISGARSEEKYEREKSEKLREIQKLQERIAALDLAQGDRAAALEKAELMEELSELQLSLDDLMAEHYINSAEKALDDELKMFEDKQDAKIDSIQEFLDDNKAVNQVAIEKLDDMNAKLFDSLLDYALTYTDTTRSEMLAMWDEVTKAAEKYGSVTNASKVYEESDASNEVQAQLERMRRNGQEYGTATKERQEWLAKDSKAAGDELERLLGVTVKRDNNGVWWIGDGADRRKLFEIYAVEKHHTGTAAIGGSSTLKQNEVFALLEKGETVLTKTHMETMWALLNNVNPVKWLNRTALSKVQTYQTNNAYNPTITVEAPVFVDGMMTDRQIMDVLKNHSYDVANMVAKKIRK